jgi:thioredoxin 1
VAPTAKTIPAAATAAAVVAIKEDNMAEIVITKENFEAEVLKSDIPVILDFWATWCGPCRMIAPTLARIAESHEGIIKIGKVNVDEQMELAVKFGITSIPCLFVIKDGKAVERLEGLRPKEEILPYL